MKNSIFKTGWFLLFAAGLLAVMSACKKENTTSELRAVMNDYANSRQKAYIDPEQYNCFVVNETVRVNNSTGVITALERSDRQCVIDEVPVNSGSNYNAFYPAKLLASQTVGLSSGLNGVEVNFPQTQVCTRDANGNQIIDNPMIAQLSGFDADDNYTLHFNNVCALLKVTVRTQDAYDAIHVTMSGQQLWGSGVISGSKVVMDGNSGSSTVILSIPGHTNSPAGEAFYIMIPEVTLSSSTVTVSIKNGNNPPVKTFERTGVSGTLEYNKIHTLGNFTFNAKVFSVAANKTVIFAPGNLQWSYTNGGTTPTTHSINGSGYNKGTWRFAPKQYEVIGAGNVNAVGDTVMVGNQNNPTPINSMSYENYQGWIDLFAWGGSGYEDSRPYYYSTHSYNNNKVYYCENNLLGNYDWGSFNTIYNPKTKANDPYGTWRMLDTTEWHYLLFNRGSGDDTCRFSLVGIILPSNTTIYGMMIYPDNTTITAIRSIKADVNDNEINSSYRFDISESLFSQFEELGCAFLPSAGKMNYAIYGKTIDYQSTNGHYWTNQANQDPPYYYYATGLYITSGGYKPYLRPSIYDVRRDFHSVRLVRDVR